MKYCEFARHQSDHLLFNQKFFHLRHSDWIGSRVPLTKEGINLKRMSGDNGPHLGFRLGEVRQGRINCNLL